MLIDAFCHTVVQTLNQLLYVFFKLVFTVIIDGLEGRLREHIRAKMHKNAPRPEKKVCNCKRSASVSLQTLIRNLRDSSIRVTLVRPALWQMDTALLDQAVEKFSLKNKNNHLRDVFEDNP